MHRRTHYSLSLIKPVSYQTVLHRGAEVMHGKATTKTDDACFSWHFTTPTSSRDVRVGVRVGVVECKLNNQSIDVMTCPRRSCSGQPSSIAAYNKIFVFCRLQIGLHCFCMHITSAFNTCRQSALSLHRTKPIAWFGRLKTYKIGLFLAAVNHSVI